MKISCEKSDLLNSIQMVFKAVSSKSTMSIIECILIRAGEDGIKFTANNMELAIETILEGNIEEEGMIALEAKFFLDVVRHLPDSEVKISTLENNLTLITCEKNNIKIIGKPGDDFPLLPDVEKQDPLVISHMILKDIVRQTVFSIKENDNNRIMAGELLEVKNSELKLASLDGYRISVRNVELSDPHTDISTIIPGKTLNELSKIISGEYDRKLEIFFTDKHVLFEFDNTRIVSRVIEGEYYNISQMISNDYETKITVNKKEITESIERARVFVKEGENKPIILNITDDVMEIKINTSIGSMNGTVDIEKEGNDIMIGFDPAFLLDAFKVIDDETVNIYMVNPKAPCIIKDDAETYIYVILPINFNTVY